jgi:hypothetical protein
MVRDLRWSAQLLGLSVPEIRKGIPGRKPGTGVRGRRPSK